MVGYSVTCWGHKNSFSSVYSETPELPCSCNREVKCWLTRWHLVSSGKIIKQAAWVRLVNLIGSRRAMRCSRYKADPLHIRLWNSSFTDMHLCVCLVCRSFDQGQYRKAGASWWRNLLHGGEWFLRSLVVAQMVKKFGPLPVKKPEGSLSCSQEPATGLFPVPAAHIPTPYFFKYHFNIIHLCLGLSRSIPFTFSS